MTRRKRCGWRQAGCYVWRTRKPHAPLGLPFVGRHFAYVGETGSRYHRDPQHVRGGGTYGAVAKPWSDLDPKVYPLPCLFPNSQRSRLFHEKLYTRILLPVYPTENNTGNPRRITSEHAQAQRAARDRLGKSVVIVQMLVRWLVSATVLSCALLLYIHYGQGGH